MVVSVKYSRIGDQVFIQIPIGFSTTAASGTTFYESSTALPVAFRPLTETTATIMVRIINNQLIGIFRVFVTGIMRFQPLVQSVVAGITSTYEGSFPNSTACGILTSQNVSYFI